MILVLSDTCFTGETLVATENGQIRIDEIEVGDKVWAYDIFTGETALKEVLAVYVHDDETRILHLYTTSGDIDTTTNHPFYVIDRGWVAAGDLVAGDEVYLIDGSTAFVTGAELEKFTEPITVYNLEVADFHTYFVGETCVLVHNQYKTTAEATQAAKDLGFTKVNERSPHGAPIYTNGKVYITPDVDSHIGGFWKMAKKIKDLFSKSTRLGTYDADLNRIGD